MGEVQTGIHDGDDHVGRVADQVPRGEGLDIGAGDAAGLAKVVERPLGSEGGVVGSEGKVAEAIALDKFVAAGGGEPSDSGADVIGIVEFDDAEIADVRERGANTDAVAGLLGFGRGAAGCAGFGEEGTVAETLGEFLGSDGSGIGCAGGVEGDGEKERKEDGETERRRDGEKERRRDGETEKEDDGETEKAGDVGLGWRGAVEAHDR
jgi:hypothetical protein